MPEDCNCLPTDHPEYIAAKAAFEAAKATAEAAWPPVERARDANLSAVYRATGSWHTASLVVFLGFDFECDCDAATLAAIDEARVAHEAMWAEWLPIAEAYNAALEEWDRVRDLSKVNLP